MAESIPEMGSLKGNGNAVAAGIVAGYFGPQDPDRPKLTEEEAGALLTGRALLAVAEELRTANLLTYWALSEQGQLAKHPDEVLRGRLGLPTWKP